jgi:hypothetical protein
MNILTKRARTILKAVHASGGESNKLNLAIYRRSDDTYWIVPRDSDFKTAVDTDRTHCDGSLRAVAQLSEVFHEWDKLAQKGANGPQGRHPLCDA